jgi:hypothetical protein
LRQSAVFANITGSSTDKRTQSVIHHDCLRSWERALACNTVITSMACR